MTALEGKRPASGMRLLVWSGIALALYGVLAVFGVGGLEEALAEVPATGLVGGFFVGLGLFALPAVGAWALGRPLSVSPAFPRMSAGLVWVGLVGLALIGLVAALVDVGLLDLVVVNRP